jgi:hypothetical protein
VDDLEKKQAKGGQATLLIEKGASRIEKQPVPFSSFLFILRYFGYSSPKLHINYREFICYEAGM